MALIPISTAFDDGAVLYISFISLKLKVQRTHRRF
jgi:hypothetical protein